MTISFCVLSLATAVAGSGAASCARAQYLAEPHPARLSVRVPSVPHALEVLEYLKVLEVLEYLKVLSEN